MAEDGFSTAKTNHSDHANRSQRFRISHYFQCLRAGRFTNLVDLRKNFLDMVLLSGLGLFVLSSLVVIDYMSEIFGWGAAVSLAEKMAIAFASTILVYLLEKNPKRYVWILPPLFASLVALGLANSFYRWIPVPGFGDGRDLIEFIQQRRVFSRWMIGTFTLNTAYSAIMHFPPFAAKIPGDFYNATYFLKCFAPFTTFLCAAISFVLFERSRTSLFLLLSSPLALLFSIGYLEYYPVVLGPFILIVCWLIHQPLRSRNPIEIGIVTALLPLLYIGFAPLAFALLIAYIAVRPIQGMKSVVWTGLIFVALVRLS